MPHAMHVYAQTSVQLFNQLAREEYSEKDRQCIFEAYEFGTQIFSGLYLPSGKPFIDHLVGTASVLASLRVPVEIVTAGLLHAAYLHGDFGGITKGISEAKRKQVKAAVGETVEDYVAKYDQLLWTWENVLRLHGNRSDFEAVDGHVLLIRLVNELEHQLDLGGIYYVESEREQKEHQINSSGYGPVLVSMAQRLGYFSLAEEMTQVFNNIVSEQIPVVPWIRSNHRNTYLVAPKSYRQRYLIVCWQNLCESYRVIGILLSSWKVLYRTARRRIGRIFRLFISSHQ